MDGRHEEIVALVKTYGEMAEARLFVEGYRSVLERGSGRVPPRLNAWSEPGLLRQDEVSFCRVLQWFLDPEARHDQGTRFLRSFLQRFVPRAHGPQRHPYRVRVHREYRQENCRIDIAIHSQTDFIGLEAKINSRFVLEQLQSYRREFSSKCRFHGLFLVRDLSRSDQDKLHEVGFQGLTWAQVRDWLREEGDLLKGVDFTASSLTAYLAGNFADAIDNLYQKPRRP